MRTFGQYNAYFAEIDCPCVSLIFFHGYLLINGRFHDANDLPKQGIRPLWLRVADAIQQRGGRRSQ